MAFDWTRFLAANGVDYVTRGPNVARGDVNVRCPFCGEADRSHHMGINLAGKGWGCWRNANHRGKSRSRLIAALLRCSNERARLLAGEHIRPVRSDADLGAELRASLGVAAVESTEPATRPVIFPDAFKPLRSGDRWAGRFWDYLAERGYSNADAKWIASAYGLHYATSGDYAYRLIVPIQNERGDTVSWTARGIGQQVPKYKTLPGQSRSPKNWVLGLPLLYRCPNPGVLLVCEGPFDAMRVSALGRTYGIYGTCLFGLTLAKRQAKFLLSLTDRFELYLVIDDDAQLRAFDLTQRLGGCSRLALPKGVSDPGELAARQMKELARAVGVPC